MYVLSMKRKFKHRKVSDYSYRCFNRLLDSLVKSGFKIECCDLTEYKPMITKEKEEIYRQRADEYCTRVLLENFILKINDSIKDVFENDLLNVEKI